VAELVQKELEHQERQELEVHCKLNGNSMASQKKSCSTLITVVIMYPLVSPETLALPNEAKHE